MRRALLPLAVAVAAALTAPAAMAAGAAGPEGDAFYTPPEPLTGKTHGDLIWQRPMTGGTAVPGAAANALVLYRSTAVDGRPTAVSGMVALPKGKAPKAGWPVVTYAHGTTGIADQCAPSRALPGEDSYLYTAYINQVLQRWLKAGYAVVRTDYEGLGTPGEHPYLVGSSEGRGTLDIVRAARRLDPRIGKRVFIAGHSQGGHAALWAAALAPKWTPELDVRGTVAFAPASHIGDQLNVLSILKNPGGGLSGLVAMIARGNDLARPELNVATLLGDRALELWPETLTKCVAALGREDSFGALAPADMLRPGADTSALLKALNAGDPETLRIRTPVRIDQGAADGTVLPMFTDGLVGELRENKVKLDFKSYPGVDHAGIPGNAAATATAWMKRQLKPAAKTKKRG